MSSSDGYRLVRHLGSGLSGHVYLAETDSGKAVVRQFQSQAQAGSEEWQLERQHFLQAGHQVAALSHPRIIQITDVIDEGTEAYVATEYVAGETLDSILTRQRFSPEEAHALLRQIATALDYAHQNGVVHGDLKPSKVFVLSNGAVKVGDFAISPRGRRPSPGSLLPGHLHQYLSPEHLANSQAIGSRSDQYALAAIAYHLYTGRPPHWERATELELAIPSGDIRPPSSVRRRLPSSLDLSLLKALSAKPVKRYNSCLEFISHLEAATDSMSSARSRFSRESLGAYIILLSIVILALIFFWPRKQIEPAVVNPTARAPKSTPPSPPSPASESDHEKNGNKKTAAKPPAAQAKDAAATTEKVKSVAGVASSARSRPKIVEETGSGRTDLKDSVLSGALAWRGFTLAVMSRSRRIEQGSSFPAGDTVLGELGHGDLKALIGTVGPAPRGRLTLEWVIDDVPMDEKVITLNQPVEYDNEPTVGTYRVVLRLDGRPMQSFTFRITP